MNTVFGKILFSFSILMALAYVTIGLYLIISGRGFESLATPARVILGGFFIVYGSFRFYRYWKKNKEDEHDTADGQD